MCCTGTHRAFRVKQMTRDRMYADNEMSTYIQYPKPSLGLHASFVSCCCYNSQYVGGGGGGPFILQRGQYNTLGNYYLQVHFLVILGLNFVIFTCE